MVKISFYRRLQKELSTDIGIVSGNFENISQMQEAIKKGKYVT